MQVYKRKAVENERKWRQKKSNHLFSKVESILAKADVSFIVFVSISLFIYLLCFAYLLQKIT